MDYINKTIKSTLGLKQESGELHTCEPCLLGKFHHINNKTPMSSAKNLAVFDVDICGPIKPLGLKGERYFMTITDRGSRVAWVYSIKNKGDAYSVLLDFFKLINTQFDLNNNINNNNLSSYIKVIKLDNIAEFKSIKWTLFIKDKGIIYEYTSPYSIPQNGIAEILNKYIIKQLITFC
jgi:transposase InsO family protein